MIYSTEINGVTFYCIEHIKACERAAWFVGLVVGIIVGITFMGIIQCL
jgi:hypothetical protein